MQPIRWLRIPAMAALAALALQAQAAERPDFSGIWAPETWSTEGWPEEPPFTEAGRAAQEAWAADPASDPSHRCVIPLGRIISAPLPQEVIQLDDRVVILYEYDHQVRRLFLDGRGHPDSYPTLMGHSVARWEGDTLVAETVAVEPGLFRPQGLPYTGGLTMTERFSLLDGGDRLRIELEIDDPEYYSEPWTVTKHYSRSDEELKDYECIVREHVPATP